MVKILEVKTEHVIPFKTIFEVLKDVLTDVSIEFSNDHPANDGTDRIIAGGIKIVTVDPTRSVLINLKLDADQFATYMCSNSPFDLGVNLSTLYKLLKNIEKDDMLTLFVEDFEKQYLSLQIENMEKKCITMYRLKLMDLDNIPLKIPAAEYDAMVTMSSSDFHKVCKEMHQISEYIEIKCTPRYIKFTFKGDSSDGSKVFMADEKNGINIKYYTESNNSSFTIIQGIYELKNLTLFTKCTNLCNDIQIYMKNNFPLVIKYTIATLGRILLCLTPISDPDTKSDSDDCDDVSDNEMLFLMDKKNVKNNK